MVHLEDQGGGLGELLLFVVPAPDCTVDAPLRVTIPCAATSATGGATCSITTTADTVLPGVVPEGRRSVWELGPVEVFDGGADGLASSTGDNSLFTEQGLFVP